MFNPLKVRLVRSVCGLDVLRPIDAEDDRNDNCTLSIILSA